MRGLGPLVDTPVVHAIEQVRRTDPSAGWLVYEDNMGRSRALRYRDTDNFLFPATMIARRQEAGSNTPVADIYRKAYLSIDRQREPLPFQ